MLKSTIAAAFVITTFTIVTIGAVSISGEQALAAKAIPVEAKRASKLAEQCLLSGGSSLVTKDDDPNSTLTLACCAINSEGVKWCVACIGGTVDHPTDCTVVTKERVNLPGSLKPKPGQGQLAPTKDKPRLPPVMGKILKAPVTNAPTTNTLNKRLFFKQFKKLKK
ncbi:MAG: hypothetical protein ACTSUY_11515 [Alphaproteobacteria bacterium]